MHVGYSAAHSSIQSCTLLRKNGPAKGAVFTRSVKTTLRILPAALVKMCGLELGSESEALDDVVNEVTPKMNYRVSIFRTNSIL